MLVRVLRSNRNGLSSTLLIYFRTARVDGIRVVSYLVIRKDYSEAVSHSSGDCVALGRFLLVFEQKGWCGQGVVPSSSRYMEFGSDQQWDIFWLFKAVGPKAIYYQLLFASYCCSSISHVAKPSWPPSSWTYCTMYISKRKGWMAAVEWYSNVDEMMWIYLSTLLALLFVAR